MHIIPEQLRGGGAISRLRDEVATPEHAWTALAFVAAAVSAAASRHLLQRGWRAAIGTEPPISPSAENAAWIDTLVWGVATGAIVGVIRAVSRHGARSAQHRWS